MSPEEASRIYDISVFGKRLSRKSDNVVVFHLLSTSQYNSWKRMEKISWTDHVRNEEVLLRVNEQRNILHEIRKWKICHILRRNCLLKQVIEEKI